ncbi:hypothetical protein D3C78_1074260 [compost metagenome]
MRNAAHTATHWHTQHKSVCGSAAQTVNLPTADRQHGEYVLCHPDPPCASDVPARLRQNLAPSAAPDGPADDHCWRFQSAHDSPDRPTSKRRDKSAPAKYCLSSACRKSSPAPALHHRYCGLSDRIYSPARTAALIYPPSKSPAAPLHQRSI